MKPNSRTLMHLLAACCLLGSLVAFSSCDSFLDVNKNPNFPEDASPVAKLPSIIANGFQQQYALGVLITTHFTQHIAGRTVNNGNDQFFLAPTASPFNDTYFRAASNIPPMIQRAEREQAWHFVGAGKALMAILLFHITDIYGDIPYSQGFRGAEDYTPKYDSQEQIYQQMDKLLDEALVEFAKTQPASAPRFNADADILYAGDVSKWVKLVYTIKARQYNHLTKKANYNAQRVLDAAAKGITNNTDDAQVRFSSAQVAVTNVFAYQRANYNTRTFGKYFIQMLDGTTLGFRDPRYVIIAPDTARSKGAVNGAGTTGVLASNASDFYGRYATPTPPVTGTLPAVEGWYAQTTGVQLLATNSELKFITAEAAFRAGNRATAYTAYIDGITAHMSKLGVAAADQTAYLKSAAVKQDAASLTLGDIMRQKYIALFLHPEAWVDMRRFDYSTDIYTGFTPPVNASRDLMGQYPRRFLPGQQELLYNRVNAYAELGELSDPAWILSPVWWDKR